MPARHFPPPWSIKDTGARFIVREGTTQQRAKAAAY
jgi:hypothetical protein